MPFTGGYARHPTTHPSTHHRPYGGNLSVDLYAQEGTAVRVRVLNPTGTLEVRVARVYPTPTNSGLNCGTNVKLNILVDGQVIGWVQYGHLDEVNVQGGQTIANGTILGVLRWWPRSADCYDVISANGVHTHFEVRNQSNASCYIDPPRGRIDQNTQLEGDALTSDPENRRRGLIVADNTQIGVLGGAYATTNGASCPGKIDPRNWEASSNWNEYGPAYEGNDAISSFGARHTHAYGRATGKMTYQFNLRAVPPSVRLSARLSSEFPGYSGPANGYSDVTLIINGNRYSPKRVRPDNGTGRRESWTVNPTHLRVGQNTVAFEVLSSSTYRNGVCIYKRPVEDFQYSEFQEYIRMEYP